MINFNFNTRRSIIVLAIYCPSEYSIAKTANSAESSCENSNKDSSGALNLGTANCVRESLICYLNKLVSRPIKLQLFLEKTIAFFEKVARER